MTLEEFLEERIAEDHQCEKDAAWRRMSTGMPADMQAEARPAWEKTLEASAIDFNYAMYRLGWTLPGLRHAAKVKAASYADHPDYDERWRP